MNLLSDWCATDFFENLCASNKLAQSEHFVFTQCSGLEGFEEALQTMQSSVAIVAVSDIADGYTELNNTPRTRRVKTIFLAMRHAAEDMDARNSCMEIMRELFRQFMSRLLLEKVRLEQNCMYIDPRISFNEIDRYFFSGCACSYFQIAIDVYTDLRHNSDEWIDGYDTDQYKYLPTNFDIWLIDYDKSRGATTIKLVRDFTKLSLKESRDIVNSVPQTIFEDVTKNQYPDIVNSFAAIGATVKFLRHGQKP